MSRLSLDMTKTSFRFIHGTSSATADAPAELVRTKLEMGGAGRLSFAGAFGGRMQQQRKWTNRRDEFIHSVERAERESYALCRSEEIGGYLAVSNHGRQN